MDPIVTKLNQEALKKLGKADLPAGGQKIEGFQSPFDHTLTNKMMDRLKEDSAAANNMNVLAAGDIHIQTNSPELSTQNLGASDQFFNMFKELNVDLLSLDTALEVLTTPGLKIGPQQLLTLQAGVANTTILAEGFSKFTDGMARGIQTVLQTQVG